MNIMKFLILFLIVALAFTAEAQGVKPAKEEFIGKDGRAPMVNASNENHRSQGAPDQQIGKKQAENEPERLKSTEAVKADSLVNEKKEQNVKDESIGKNTKNETSVKTEEIGNSTKNIQMENSLKTGNSNKTEPIKNNTKTETEKNSKAQPAENIGKTEASNSTLKTEKANKEQEKQGKEADEQIRSEEKKIDAEGNGKKIEEVQNEKKMKGNENKEKIDEKDKNAEKNSPKLELWNSANLVFNQHFHLVKL